MPIISVTTWPSENDEKCHELMEELTETVHRVTGAPRDRITVYIQEVSRNRWSEGGAVGSDPDFARLSRAARPAAV
ncbi:4-oxalocrotonate tautomerase family protein [Streptomyces sp. NPDC001568]|uniref:tautomerase family protein n=1 Tax=Streptomyces sp. NPDC001568 TaxID=3364588 RepID=UPI0036B95FD7